MNKSNKILEKAAIYTDIHFGARRDSIEHGEDCLHFLRWFAEQCHNDPSIDHILFLGDYFDNRDRIKTSSLDYGYKGAEILNDIGLPLWHLVGNHECGNRHNRDIISSLPFEQFSNFTMVSEPIVVKEMGEHGAVLSPYLFEHEYPSLRNFKGIPTLYIHAEFKGFVVTGESRVMEHGPEHTDYKMFRRILSGHFHKHQIKDNVIYVGNPFATSYADANQNNKGMATYEYKTDTYTQIPWEAGPKFTTVDLTDLLENPKKILIPSGRVKVKVDTDLTLEEANVLREKFQEKYNLREITLEESYSIDVELSEDEKAIEELHLETTNEVIQELLKRIKDDAIDNDELLKIYNSLKTNEHELDAKAASIEFLEMTMQNYLSYGNDTTTVNLNFSDPTLIVGRNYDSIVNGQIDSNGSGKSATLMALLMCLFDKNLMPVDKDAQINKTNGKNMLLSTTFKVDGTYYKVERYRKNKVMGGNGVKLYKNTTPTFSSEHDITPDSVANCNALIERILGIPYEMFIRIVVFSATHEPFLSLPSSHASKANQRDIIEELFGLTELTHKSELLKELITVSKADIRNLQAINTQIKHEHERYENQIANTEDKIREWNCNQEIKMDNVKHSIEVLSRIDTHDSIDGFTRLAELNEELIKVQKNIPVLETELKHIQTIKHNYNSWIETNKKVIESTQSKIDELKDIDFGLLKRDKEQLRILDKEVSELDYELNKTKSDIQAWIENVARLEKSKEKKLTEIDHLSDNKCPYCKQQFEEAQGKVAECKHSIKEYDDGIEIFKKDIELYSQSIGKTEELLNTKRLKLLNLKAKNIPDNLEAMEATLHSLIQKLEELKTARNPHQLDGDGLSESDIMMTLEDIKGQETGVQSKIKMAREFIHPSFNSMSDVKEHTLKIKTLEEKFTELNKEVNPFIGILDSICKQTVASLKTNEINDLDKTIKHQEFLLKLLTKKDSFIRKALLNKSIPLLNTRLRANLDKIGLPHKVVFTEEMEVAISQFDVQFEYGNFSSGQKARVNLCLAFAFRDVLQSRFGKINLCILDECLDTGLGNVGVTQAASMIKQIALENNLSMFVISHRDEVSNMFKKRMEIELRNGFSSILDESQSMSVQ